jgi:hypothetical protein
MLAFSICASTAGAQTADELIAKNLAARGGEAKLATCETIRMTGELPAATGGKAIFLVEVKQPDKLILEVTVGDKKNVQILNGTSGWEVLGISGQTEPKPMKEQQMRSLRHRVNYRGELFDARRLGTPVEYQGQIDLGGTPAHVLKVTKSNGDVALIYLDARSFLEIKQEHVMHIGVYTVEFTSFFKDYGEAGGLVFAHNLGLQFKGEEEPQWIPVKYEVNPELADARFVFAETGKEATGAQQHR